MTKPVLRVNGPIYYVEWTDLQISMKFDRLREHKDTVSAEVKIEADLPATASHLHQARINLVSTQQRKSLAGFLEQRTNGAVADWQGMVEQATIMVLSEYRKGEPVVKIGDVPQSERLQFLIEPVMRAGQINLWWGPGGSGKTTMADYLATLVSEGLSGEDMGMLAEPGNVLYLDWETDSEEHSDRIRKIQAGLGVETASDIFYRYCSQALASDIEEIQAIVAEHKIDFVIADSLGQACGDEPNEAKPVLAYFNALRTLRRVVTLEGGQEIVRPVTSLTIDHPTKEGKLYGSVYKFNQARSIFEFKKSQEPGDDFLEVGIFHRKMNNGKLIKPLGFRLVYSDHDIRCSRTDVREVPEFDSYISAKEKLRMALKAGSLSVADAAEETGLSEDTTRKTLNRHLELFTRLSSGDHAGKWGLLSKESQV